MVQENFIEATGVMSAPDESSKNKINENTVFSTNTFNHFGDDFIYEETWKNDFDTEESKSGDFSIARNCCCCKTTTIAKMQRKYTNWAYKHPWVILICLCYASMVCSMTGIGYLGVVIQDIEKQYGLSSTHSGFISACLDVAFCCVALLIGWRLKKQNLGPISLGMAAVTVGCFLFVLPLAVIHTDVRGTNQHMTNANDSLCFINKQTPPPPLNTISTIFNSISNDANFNANEKNKGGLTNGHRALAIFYVAFAFIGMGSAPVFILSPIILKNLLSEQRRSTYLSIFYLTTLMGPSIAYFSSNPFLKIPVFLKPLENTHEFIGAWWLCFVFGGIASWLCLITITINSVFFNPTTRHITYNASSIPTHNGSVYSMRNSDEKGHHYKMNKLAPSHVGSLGLLETPAHNLGTLQKFKLLMTNHCYLCVSFSSTLVQFLIAGFATFLPKFMENNFTILPESAVLLVGVIIVPSAALGSVVGGCLIRKFKLNLSQICFLCFICSFLATISIFCFLIQCPRVTNITPDFSSVGQSIFSIQNIEKCWPQCGERCETLPLQPVCYQEQRVSFLNPCFAGCRTNNGTHYIDCSCLSTINPTLTPGLCSLYCNKIYPFSVLMFLLNFFLFTMYVPMTEVTMRAVPGNLLTMALGFQQVLQRLLGQVPGPIMIGKLIDLSCVYWKTHGSESHCYVYNTVKYRLHMTVLGVPVLLVNTLCMFAAYSFSKKGNHSL